MVANIATQANLLKTVGDLFWRRTNIDIILLCTTDVDKALIEFCPIHKCQRCCNRPTTRLCNVMGCSLSIPATIRVKARYLSTTTKRHNRHVPQMQKWGLVVPNGELIAKTKLALVVVYCCPCDQRLNLLGLATIFRSKSKSCMVISYRFFALYHLSFLRHYIVSYPVAYSHRQPDADTYSGVYLSGGQTSAY